MHDQLPEQKTPDLSDPVRQAILDLLDEKKYSEIQVVEIAERAGIARQTFYKRYPSKDELLLSFMDDVFEEFLTDIQPDILKFPNNAQEVYEKLYTQWASYSGILLKVIDAGVDHLVYQRFRRYITRVVGNVSRKQDIQITDPDLVEYFIDFFAGGAYQAIVRWMRSGMQYPPRVMATFMVLMLKSDVVGINAGGQEQ